MYTMCFMPNTCAMNHLSHTHTCRLIHSRHAYLADNTALQGVLPCVAVCCRVLQCVAVCCNVLQCAAMCCRVLQWVVNIASQIIVSHIYLSFLHTWHNWLSKRTFRRIMSETCCPSLFIYIYTCNIYINIYICIYIYM